jgi:membrane protein YdbS with pleckstrin-like domain
MNYSPLAPAARTVFHLKALMRLALFWTPTLLGLTVAGALFGSFFWSVVIGAGLWLLAAIFSVWYPSFAFERWGYVLLDEVLVITWGVWFRNVVAIPLHRIQHVDTHQGPIDQLFDLARLQIYTASGLGADGIIPGLDHRVAEALRAQLIEVGGDDGV